MRLLQAPSQLMSPYRRGTPFQWRWLRRLWYGRGYGVHSPLAYASICSIVRPVGSYYIEEQDIWQQLTEEQRLWFRMLARFGASETSYFVSNPSPYLELEKYAFSQPILNAHHHLGLTDDATRVPLFFQKQTTHSLSALLLLGIRKDRSSEASFLKLLKEYEGGVVLDCFTVALFFNNNYERYYYRTSL